MTFVSIVMPCYNASATLDDALHSIFIQTYKEFEIIAIDDGSTDSTASILQNWNPQDRLGAKLRILNQPHAGILHALNNGISSSKGDYIARMDADDRCHPERLEKQVQMLETNPNIDVAGCLVQAFPEDLVREGFRIYIDWLNSLVTNEDIRREMFVESPLAHPSVLIRKQYLEKIGRYEEHGWPEDYDLWLRMYIQGAHFAKVPQFLLEWRESPNRLTRQDSRYSVENFLRAKAHYLVQGPLLDRDAVIIWGAGMMGRRLGKQLIRVNAPVKAFIDIDPRKIGRTRRGRPILAPEALTKEWEKYDNPVLLAAVGARGARNLIRQRLEHLGFVEGKDWWSTA